MAAGSLPEECEVATLHHGHFEFKLLSGEGNVDRQGRTHALDAHQPIGSLTRLTWPRHETIRQAEAASTIEIGGMACSRDARDVGYKLLRVDCHGLSVPQAPPPGLPGTPFPAATKYRRELTRIPLSCRTPKLTPMTKRFAIPFISARHRNREYPIARRQASRIHER